MRKIGKNRKNKNVQTLKKFFYLKTMFLAEHDNAFQINSEAFACPSMNEKGRVTFWAIPHFGDEASPKRQRGWSKLIGILATK